MIVFKKTDSANEDFKVLVAALDEVIRIRDGEDHVFYDQFNKLDNIKHVVVAYENEEAVGCGAIKEYSKDTMEVKRMFVPEQQRGKGIATQILMELENWARALGYHKCILETGIKHPEAIALYKKQHYKIIPNYDQYENVKTSVCFEKLL